MRPRHPTQCIGPNREGNERMRTAWALNLEYGDTVWILLANGKHEEWNFSHYTQSGARLWDKIDGRWYTRLINWDRGDQIFTEKRDLNVKRLYTVISERTRAQMKVDACDEQVKLILEELGNDKSN